MIGTATTMMVTFDQSVRSHAASPSKIAIPSAICSFVSRRQPRSACLSIDAQPYHAGAHVQVLPSPCSARCAAAASSSRSNSPGKVVARERGQVAGPSDRGQAPEQLLPSRVEASLAAPPVEGGVHGGGGRLLRPRRQDEQDAVVEREVERLEL